MSGNYQRKDHLYRQAKAEGYRSRAAYKLIELDRKHKLLRKGASVLDLGCYPGGWLQVARQRVGPQGVVVGVDLKEVEPLAGTAIIKGDVTTAEVIDALTAALGGRADVIISDLSPALSGIKFADAARSAELTEVAFRTAHQLLKPGGALAAKIFPGPESDQLYADQRKFFARLTRIVLGTSRNSSSEYYLVGKGFRAHQPA